MIGDIRRGASTWRGEFDPVTITSQARGAQLLQRRMQTNHTDIAVTS